MVSTIGEAIDYLYRSLRKTTIIISDGCYEVDGEKYTAAEVMKLANSTDPRTWHRLQLINAKE